MRRFGLSRKKSVVVLLVLAVLVGAGAATASVTMSRSHDDSIALAPTLTPSQLAQYPGANWPTNGGDIRNDRFSSLKTITPSNVGSLTQAWSTDLGVCPTHNTACGSEEASPVVWDGTMFYQTNQSDVFALNATNGQVLWHYKPTFDPGFSIGTGGREPGVAVGDGLVYAGQKDGNLVALNQQTGAIQWKVNVMPWQKGGSLDAAPLFYDGMVIEGTSGGDGGSLSSVVEAFNAETGQVLWSWGVVPQTPGQTGWNTWSYNGAKTGSEYGGGAIWQTPAVDEKDGLLIFGTGNPVPWNSRGPGENLFTNSIVALNIHTGTMKWYYQTVHHDLWDSDLPNNAVIFTAKSMKVKENVTKNGKTTVQTETLKNETGVADVAKYGWTWMLDAKTGKPIEQVDQVKVPQSTAPDVNTWPTQPIPQGPNVVDDPKMPNGQGRQCARPDEWTGTAPDGNPYKVGCYFDPYTTSQFVVAPFEEMDWPASSYDPLTQGFITCGVSNRAFGKEQIPAASQVYSSKGGIGSGILSEPDSAKDNTGNFSSLNVGTNKFNWHQAWAAPCYSGSFNTASGLTFIGHIGPGNGQTGQGYLEAVNSKTGQSLWTSPAMTAPATSPSITYSVNGVQYVAIMAGGEAHDDPTGGIRGDTIYAYALPSS